MKHTKGEWLIAGFTVYALESVKGKYNTDGSPQMQNRFSCIIQGNTLPNEEAEANAKLIAEAGTVANETGKTPRQLADLNKELLEAMQRQYLLHLIFMPSHYRNTVAGQDVLTMCLNSISTATGKDHQAVQDYFEELSALVKSNEIQFSDAIKKATE